jgi:hypothetical protein
MVAQRARIAAPTGGISAPAAAPKTTYKAGFRQSARASRAIASSANAAPRPRTGSMARWPRRSSRRALTGAVSVPAEKAPLAAPAAANDPVAWWMRRSRDRPTIPNDSRATAAAPNARRAPGQASRPP